MGRKKNKYFRRIYIAVIGFLVIVLVFAAIMVYRIFHVQNSINIDKEIYPITGIDVSGHTGKIVFNKISEQNIDFVYLKATEGADFVDPRFEVNYSNAKLINLPVGFYHFFRFNRSGKVQTNNFLKNIKEKKADLPLVIDVEEWGNDSNIAANEVINEIRSFIDIVESKTAKRVMIYSNESGYKKYIKGSFENNDIWICSFRKSPEIDIKWMLLAIFSFWQIRWGRRFG